MDHARTQTAQIGPLPEEELVVIETIARCLSEAHALTQGNAAREALRQADVKIDEARRLAQRLPSICYNKQLDINRRLGNIRRDV